MKYRVIDPQHVYRISAIEVEAPNERAARVAALEAMIGRSVLLVPQVIRDSMGFLQIESPIPDALSDCLHRTIQHCEEALEEPLRQKLFKAQTAAMWLKTLKGWLPDAIASGP